MSELLSPAGTIESFYAAISGGCNAIYLGLNRFSARAYANNFSIEELKELIKYAHLRNVKVYVTMNTIVYDEELEEVFKLIDELANINVDAIIVQDLALINYTIAKYKSIAVHASTQMGIENIDGAILLKNLGLSRIVFARETPLSILKHIKNNLDIEIECFVHGALCVSYSGNCLMSSMIGDRSGNRGRCAGCCRQFYSLINIDSNEIIKEGYLLSMKDLNTSSQFKNMKFIDSYKIEGRMKEPSYVKYITNYYRRIIDNESSEDDNIKKLFNRKYTKGFLNGESVENITNIDRPNNYGYHIGNVVKINKELVWIRLNETLNKGDQIRIEKSNSFQDVSIAVTKLYDANLKECESSSKVVIISTKEKVYLGSKVYKTKDKLFIDSIERSLINKDYKKIGISLEFTSHQNKKAILKLECNKHIIYIKSEENIEKAITRSTTKENIFTQLNKLNDTPYFASSIKIDIDDELFIPLKLINELRRKAVNKLNDEILAFSVVFNNSRDLALPDFQINSPIITVEVNNYEQYKVAKELGIKHIYFNNVVRRNNEMFKEFDSDEILIGGYGAINHYSKSKYKLIGDYSFNVSNHIAAAVLFSLGLTRVTLSPEINRNGIMHLINKYKETFRVNPNFELIVYGRSKMMHSKYCPLKRVGLCGECRNHKYALKDKYETFPILFDDDCTTTILNSKTYNVIDMIGEIKGINYFRLVFTTETIDETRKIISKLKNKLDRKQQEEIFDQKNDTRGHFYKKVL